MRSIKAVRLVLFITVLMNHSIKGMGLISFITAYYNQAINTLFIDHNNKPFTLLKNKEYECKISSETKKYLILPDIKISDISKMGTQKMGTQAFSLLTCKKKRILHKKNNESKQDTSQETSSFRVHYRRNHMIYSIRAAYNQKSKKYLVHISDKKIISGNHKCKTFIFEGREIQESDIEFTEYEHINVKCNWLGECKETFLTANIIRQ